MMEKRWHLLSTKEQEELLDSQMKLKSFMEKYSQPEWCSYPRALESMMGCWSLMTPGRIRDRSSCGNCECLIQEEES